MVARGLQLRDYRSYASLELELAAGLVLVVGPNGAGKTNLLESLHVATQGFSPRTRQDAQLIRFDAQAARIAVAGSRRGRALDVTVILRRGEAKEARLNGARLPSAELLRRELGTLVFTPDRLTVVKGGPAARRAYFDRVLGRLLPGRASEPQEYLAALAQRNAGLRRIAVGAGSRESLAPWTAAVATLGTRLSASRSEVLATLAGPFAVRAGELGLAGARLVYEPAETTAAALEARLARDLERGTTGLGPHLDEIGVFAGDRDLRQYGSQGEQRLAVLSLLLAEAALLPTPPLLLLDDVLSELDRGRRRILAEHVAGTAQTVITTTHAAALPVEPAQVVEVEHGTAR